MPLSAVDITPDLAAKAREDGKVSVIVTFKDKANRSKLRRKTSVKEVGRILRANYTVSSRSLKQDFAKLGKKADSKILDEFWAANALAAEVSEKMLETLKDNPDIAQITMDRVIPFEEPPVDEEAENADLDGKGGYTYGLRKLSVDKVREAYNLTGEGVTVGILDTGVDAEHPDLKGKIIGWKDWSGDNSEKPRDYHGHGTHVAGTIAGGDKSGKQIGVAPKAKIIFGRIFSDKGSATLKGILGAMTWMTDPDGNPETADAPSILSNSWGGNQASMAKEKSLWNLVETWRSLNIVPVFAAGNSGPWKNTIGTPGGYPHSFAVGSTTSKDRASFFSSRGPIKWEGVKYIKPDITAPGSGVYSSLPGGKYTKMSGTSMACPHVAGLSALMLEADPSLKVDQLIDILQSTSKDLGKKGLDKTYGHGRANIKAAIDKIKGASSKQLNSFNAIYDR